MSAGAWRSSTKRLALPTYAIDESIVAPKKQRCEKPAAKLCQPEYRGSCCGGFHWWGHGIGTLFPPTRNLEPGQKQQRIFRCMQSGCNKRLPKLEDTEWQRRNAEWEKLTASIGLEEARALWMDMLSETGNIG